MTANRVSKLLDDIRLLDEQRCQLVQVLRQAVLDLDPAITEEVKYGGLLFSAAKTFCGIFSYSKHVTLEFGDGAALPDPHGVLEGEGKLRRQSSCIPNRICQQGMCVNTCSWHFARQPLKVWCLA